MNKVRLGSIASLKTGPFGTQFSAKEYTETGVPVINVKNIGYGEVIENDLDYISEETKNRLSEHILMQGDIVFGRKGSVDRHAYISENYEGWVQGSDCIRVRCDDEINKKYISHYLKLNHIKKMVNNAAVGSTMASMNTDILRDIEILLPELKVQNKIERIVSLIEAKICLNRKINDNLEEQLQILFDYWFKQFDFPNENNEPYKRSGGKMYWDSVYKRNIPTGWEILKFDDLVATPPKTPSIMAPDYKNIGLYPIIDQASSYITGRTDDISYVYPNEDDCVVFGDVTKVFKYINFPFAKGTDGTKIIRSINNRIPALILYYLIKDAKLPNKGFARYYSLLREIYVLVPSSDVSEKFIVATKPIVSKIRANLEENYKLQITRDWLLPMLMNGQATIDD